MRPWSRRFLYALVLLPVATDYIETGALPHALRGWVTEVTIGVLILLLVRAIAHDVRNLDRLVRRDALTGLQNRRAFDEVLVEECCRSQRDGRPLTLVTLDVEGDGVDDGALRTVGAAIDVAARGPLDKGFRLGGDEFALVLPNARATHARRIVGRIESHGRMRDAHWRAGRLGLSLGVVELRPGESPAEFKRRAQRAKEAQKDDGERFRPAVASSASVPADVAGLAMRKPCA